MKKAEEFTYKATVYINKDEVLECGFYSFDVAQKYVRRNIKKHALSHETFITTVSMKHLFLVQSDYLEFPWGEVTSN